jgi:hypothetical protein
MKKDLFFRKAVTFYQDNGITAGFAFQFPGYSSERIFFSFSGYLSSYK